MRILFLATAMTAILRLSQIASLGDEPAQRKLPVQVRGSVPQVVNAGEAIPLKITISNGLEWPIHYTSYSLQANAWNGETISASLVDVYRDGSANLYLAAPEVTPPTFISGLSSFQIKPDQSITLQTDARKWKLREEWKPGRYVVTVAVKNLQLDEYSTLRVLSDPILFEIK